MLGNDGWPYFGIRAREYEYQRYEQGAWPLWTPLRFPGQYHDAETDLFENRNRYYAPDIGAYLQPEPMLADPKFVRAMAESGHSLPVYAYANNNPIYYVDRNGKWFAIPAGGAVAVAIGEALVATGAIAGGVYCIGTHCLGNLGQALGDALRRAREAVGDICRTAPPRPAHCDEAAEECREDCTDQLTGSGFPFWNCVNDCLVRAGCPPGMY